MAGQMCWLSKAGIDGEKILHLRPNPSAPWRPYTSCRQYAVPDYQIPGGSKGWATYQKLMRCGWQLISTQEGQATAKSVAVMATSPSLVRS